MKLVVNRKVAKQRRRKRRAATVRNILADGAERAGEYRNVVVIAETKDGQIVWTSSRMQGQTLLFVTEWVLCRVRDEVLGE